MSTPSPRDPMLTPSQSRQLKKLWAPLWPGNRAMMREAFANPAVADAWNAFVEVYEPQERPPIKVLRAPLDALLACLADQAGEVVSVYRERLPLFLCAAAQYAHTGVIPPWTPRKVAQPTPEMCISITPEGHTLIQAGAPRQHRRWVNKYHDIMDAPGPGRPSEPVRFENAEEFSHVMRRLMFDELRAGGKITQDTISLRYGVMRDGTRSLSDRSIRYYCEEFGVEWGDLKRDARQQHRKNPA
jgi:hypothetical protein